MENKDFNNMNENEGRYSTGLENIFSESKNESAPVPAENESASEHNTEAYNTPVQQNAPQSYKVPVQPSAPQYFNQPTAPQSYIPPVQPNHTAPAPQNNVYSGRTSTQDTMPLPNYNHYQAPNDYGDNFAQQTASVNHVPPKKKSGAGKKIAVIAGVLALAICFGAGGAFIGTTLANNNNKIVAESSKATDSSKTSSESSESQLVIKQASDEELKPTTVQEVTALVKDAVVEITTETTSYDTFYGQYVSKAAGSGVIISEDGYILTNNHVIDGATSIKVRLTNEKTYDAKLIGKDAAIDIALLKIEEKDLTTATFGDSAKLSVGQTAIAIGNPLGQLGGTVTDGIISAMDREITIDGKKMNLLQTNAAINPGNSGGGLFDANGNLIGIVVAKSSSTSTGTSVEGLGFAIPINDVVSILEDLKTNGRVTNRAYLGVNLVDILTENAKFMYRVDKEGVYVSYVQPDSAAEKAGIKTYDRIVKVDDEEVSSASDLTNIILKHKKGDKVKITVERDGKEQTIDVTLGERPSDEETTKQESQQQNRSYDPFDDFFNN